MAQGVEKSGPLSLPAIIISILAALGIGAPLLKSSASTPAAPSVSRNNKSRPHAKAPPLGADDYYPHSAEELIEKFFATERASDQTISRGRLRTGRRPKTPDLDTPLTF